MAIVSSSRVTIGCFITVIGIGIVARCADSQVVVPKASRIAVNRVAANGDATTLVTTVGEVATVAVEPAPAPRVLRLPGTLKLDPRNLMHAHSRFSGEVVSIGKTDVAGTSRTLQYGDHVTQGQLLATVWSKEIGEKKSELVEALARLKISEAILDKLMTVGREVVPEKDILDARRTVEADRIDLTRVERTLRSWRVSENEIEQVKAEARSIIEHGELKELPANTRWAEVEIRAPMSGVILEKNFSLGDVVDSDDDLFKIGDLSRLQVLVSVYEEDLAAVRGMKAAHRSWTLEAKNRDQNTTVKAQFELVGNLIDPDQRTGVLMGWIDNPESALSVGQFVTAEIALAADPDLVMVPRAAVQSSATQSAAVLVKSADQSTFARCPVEIVRSLSDKLIVRAASLRVGQEIAAAADARLLEFTVTPRVAATKR